MGTSYNPRIVTDGLILCLDAANKRSYPGSGSTWNDLSKNKFAPSLINSPTFSTDNAGYFLFDGINEEVDCNFTGADVGIQGTDKATMSVWYKKTGTAGTITQELLGDGDVGRFSMRVFNTITSFQLFINGSSHNAISYSPGFYSWNNFVFVYDGANKKLYANGEFVSQYPVTGVFSSMTNNFHIGNAADGTRLLNGNIALANMYNRALTPDEIRQNYLATKGRFQ